MISKANHSGGAGEVIYIGCWRTGHGDHRPTMISKAIHSYGTGEGILCWGAGGWGTEATVLLHTKTKKMTKAWHL